MSFLLGSVPSRHFFGAVPNYYRRSLQYAIVQKLFLGKSFPHPPAFQRSLWKRVPLREFSLGFGTIKASFWRCSGLLPGVSPVFDRTETILGEIFSTSSSLPGVSLEAPPSRKFSLGFDIIKASFWRCSGLLSGVSLILDRTETILGEIFSTFANLPEVSLEARPPREFCLGFGTIKTSFRAVAVYYRGSLQYSIVQKLSLGKLFPHPPAFQRSLGKRVPPVSSLSDSVPSRHYFDAVAVYERESLQYSIVQKLFLGKYLPHPPVFQRTLWKRVSPVSSLSGSVPSKHFFGAVPNYYRRSLQYSIVQKLSLGKLFPHPPAFQRSLWKRVPPVSSLSGSVPSKHLFGAVAVYYRGLSSIRSCSGEIFSTPASLLEVSLEARPPVSSLSCSVPSRHIFGAVPNYCRKFLQYLIIQELFLGKSFPHPSAFQRSLWKRVPPVSSLSGLVSSRHLFGALPNYYRRSLQYSIVHKLFEEIFFTSASLPEVSLEARPPVSSLSGSVTSRHLLDAVPNYHRRSLQYFFQKLLLGRSLPRALPLMSSLAGVLSPSYNSGRLLIVGFFKLV